MRITEAVSNQRAVPRNWGFGNSKEKKTPFFWIEFEFLDITGDRGEHLTIRKDWYLTDNTIDYVLQDLRKLGYFGKDITEWEKNQANSFDFSTSEIEITTELQEYIDSNGNNQKIAKVKYIGGGEVGKPTMEPSELKSLAAKMKGKIAAFNAKNPAAVPSKAKKSDFLPEPAQEPADHFSKF